MKAEVVKSINDFEEYARNEARDERLRVAEEKDEDRRVLATADIPTLCRLSTDVLVGVFTMNASIGKQLSENIQVDEWLKSSGQGDTGETTGVVVNITEREKALFF